MAKRRTRGPLAVPFMMTELALSSWETIWHRSAMMASGSCSPAEYQRMVTEKMSAAQSSALAMMTSAGMAATLSPWHRRATVNAKRLRRKQ